MPIQDGKYVVPEWKNGQPPAINAQEMDAISEKPGKQGSVILKWTT